MTISNALPNATTRLVLNGRLVEADAPPDQTVLAWLRARGNLTGTKEGCGEGDCGACTVLIEASTSDGGIRRRPVNACLLTLGQVDGLGVRTVEGLRQADGSLHPVQRALAEAGGTQCGFCTPGFVMSAYAYAAGNEVAEPKTIHDALAGNLCRCTGYRPIVEAITAVTPLKDDPLTQTIAAERDALGKAHRDDAISLRGGPHIFLAPRKLDDLLAIKAANPHVVLIAGGTDLNVPDLYGRRERDALVHTAHVAEMKALRDDADTITIGAAVSYTDAMPLLTKHFPRVADYFERLGSVQVRNAGTLGGNLGTASPIGDTPPFLLAVGASLDIASVRGRRSVPLDDYFVGYRKTVLAPDEVIVAITIPKPEADTFVICEKLSKRRDQDISTVCAGFALRMSDGKVAAVRLAFGGMAGVPKRARAAEAALLGSAGDDAAFEAACASIEAEFTPLDDLRATHRYRLEAARNLLRRLHLRLSRPALVLDVHAL